MFLLLLARICLIQSCRQIEVFTFSGQSDYHLSDTCHYVYFIMLSLVM